MKLTKNNISIGAKIRLRLGKMQLAPYTSNKNMPDLVYGIGVIQKITANKHACIVKVDFSNYEVNKDNYICFSTENGIYPNIDLIE